MNRRPRPWPRARSLAAVAAVAVIGFAGCSIPVADPLVVPDCVKADGICVPEGDCAPSGGRVPGTSNCHFDDGPSECCVGTTPKANPVSCADQGGICLPGADCAPGHGYFPANGATCADPAAACCLPHALCGDQAFDCCGSGAGFAYHRALCASGKLVCEVDFSQQLLGTCSQF